MYLVFQNQRLGNGIIGIDESIEKMNCTVVEKSSEILIKTLEKIRW